ncbi:MAG: hypothetical protein P8J25_00920 [Porticoccaceae bacterium]|nr:hypothetical protein [Porticoccaceae bacterium]
MMSNSDRLMNNPRTAIAFRRWDKMQLGIKQRILKRGNYCIENLEQL